MNIKPVCTNCTIGYTYNFDMSWFNTVDHVLLLGVLYENVWVERVFCMRLTIVLIVWPGAQNMSKPYTTSLSSGIIDNGWTHLRVVASCVRRLLPFVLLRRIKRSYIRYERVADTARMNDNNCDFWSEVKRIQSIINKLCSLRTKKLATLVIINQFQLSAAAFKGAIDCKQ